jgi:hypothetical protein
MKEVIGKVIVAGYTWRCMIV